MCKGICLDIKGVHWLTLGNVPG